MDAAPVPPDVAPPPPPEAPAQSAPPQVHHPCRQCGAKLVFDPAAGAVRCSYCGTQNDIPHGADEIHELDFRTHLEAAEQQAETLTAITVQCGGCNAQVTLDAQLSSDRCPFCGSALVAERHSERLIRPGSLLPFRLSREQAFAAFGTWVRGRWFAPRQLKRYARGDASRLQGVYVPYWTYDAATTSAYSGQRGDDYTTHETYHTTVNGRRVTRTRAVRHTRWRSAQGVVFNIFDDVLTPASRSLPAPLAAGLGPWELPQLVPFDDRYLAGFQAERYAVTLAEGFEGARQVMDEGIRRSICRDIGGDHQRITSVHTQHDRVTFKHLLLPVWIGTYRFRDRTYRILVNGHSGRVQGERPLSVLKIALLVLAILGFLAMILLIVR